MQCAFHVAIIRDGNGRPVVEATPEAGIGLHPWEICRESKPSYLVQGEDDLDPAWFRHASTPDYVIDEVEARIAQLAPAAATV